MADYQFSVIVPTSPMTHEDILDATDSARQRRMSRRINPWAC